MNCIWITNINSYSVAEINTKLNVYLLLKIEWIELQVRTFKFQHLFFNIIVYVVELSEQLLLLS